MDAPRGPAADEAPENPGARDPAATRRALELAAYSPADPATAAAAAVALARFDADVASPSAPEIDADPPSTEAAAAPTESTRSSSPRRLRPHLAGALAGAAVAVAATLAATGLAGSGRPAPTPTDFSSTSDLGTAFDRVQVPPDALPDAFVGILAAPSTRLLYDEAPSGSPTAVRWRLWVGTRSGSSTVCFLFSRNDVDHTLDCVPRDSVVFGRYRFSTSQASHQIAVEIDDGSISVAAV